LEEDVLFLLVGAGDGEMGSDGVSSPLTEGRWMEVGNVPESVEVVWLATAAVLDLVWVVEGVLPTLAIGVPGSFSCWEAIALSDIVL